ncbi:hypothetical protein C4580_04140 [Candidatus Woesearchaeota archaeon]|nr:MAG: hypothetical protein C4580_04140 [Candidatus Woesearchaeota archaeon]
MTNNTLKSTLASIVIALSACGPSQKPTNRANPNPSNTQNQNQQTNGEPTTNRVEPVTIPLDEPGFPLLLNTSLQERAREVLTAIDTSLLGTHYDGGERQLTARQYLFFKDSLITPVFTKNELDVTGYFAHCRDGDELFRYQLEFEKGYTSALDIDGNLIDLVGRTITVIGDTYRVAQSRQNGLAHELILYRPEKTITLRDTNSHDNTYEPGGVIVNGEQVEDAEVKIMTHQISGAEEEISSIDVRLLADAKLGDVYVPVGGNLSAELDEPEGMLSDRWDIQYFGPRADGSHDIRFIERW